MFLADELHVMDYSLLVGVRRGRFIVNPDDGQTSLVPEGAQEAGTTEDGAVPPANPLAPATDGALMSATADTTAESRQRPPSSLSSSLSSSLPPTKEAASGGGANPSPRPFERACTSPFVGTASPMNSTSGTMPRLSLGSTSGASQRATGTEADFTSGPLPGVRESASSYKGGHGVQPLVASDAPFAGGAAAGAPPRAASQMYSEAGGGVELASLVEGPQSYHMGIVDLFQRWTIRKRLERLTKVWLKCANGEGISAVPPQEYAERFIERVVNEIFDSPELQE